MAWTIDMTGQVSLITGGATGIGAATAKSLAETGLNIAVNYYPSDRDRAAAKELVAELEAMGVRAKGYEADITNEDQVNAMVQAILADFGQIDNLFNNAGIIIKARMHEMSYSDFRKVVSVALDGAFLVTKAVLPNMLSRKCGDIALYAGLGGGAEITLVPEENFDLNAVVKSIKLNQRIGKTSDIIVLAEGVCKAEELKARLKENGVTGSIKTTTLGYIQRGGNPSNQDRTLAAEFAIRAVDLLLADKGGRVVGIRDNKIVDEEIGAALAMERKFNDELYKKSRILSL